MNITLNITTITTDTVMNGMERTETLRSILNTMGNIKIVGLTSDKTVGEMTPSSEVVYTVIVSTEDMAKPSLVAEYIQETINHSMRQVVARSVTVQEDTMTSNTTTIGVFEGKYSFLSNFFKLRKGYFVYDRFPTTEHAFQAAKSLDPMEQAYFENPKLNAYRAKLAGRELKLRSDWETKKFSFMYHIVKDKFTRDPDLKKWLLDTGDAILIEGNTWHDNIWGNCYCNEWAKARTKRPSCATTEGQNHLGKILMTLRDEFRNDNNTEDTVNDKPTPDNEPETKENNMPEQQRPDGGWIPEDDGTEPWYNQEEIPLPANCTKCTLPIDVNDYFEYQPLDGSMSYEPLHQHCCQEMFIAGMGGRIVHWLNGQQDGDSPETIIMPDNITVEQHSETEYTITPLEDPTMPNFNFDPEITKSWLKLNDPNQEDPAMNEDYPEGYPHSMYFEEITEPPCEWRVPGCDGTTCDGCREDETEPKTMKEMVDEMDAKNEDDYVYPPGRDYDDECPNCGRINVTGHADDCPDNAKNKENKDMENNTKAQDTYRMMVEHTVALVETAATKPSSVTDEEWEILSSEEYRAMLNYAFHEGMFTSDATKAAVIEMYNNKKKEANKVNDTPVDTTPPSQEDMLKQSFRLPDPDESFRISFRLDNSCDWEEEIILKTFNQVMHWLEDHISNSGEYRVERIKGNEALIININYTKEDKVYEYKLAADWTANEDVRITTNIITPTEKYALDAYNSLMDQGLQEIIIYKRQKEMTKQFIEEMTGKKNNGIKAVPMFISTNWRYVFLTERIIRVGGKFRITSMDKKVLKKMDEKDVHAMIERSSFSFSEGDNLTIFSVQDHTGHYITWDEFPAYLGIKVRNSSKLGKRLKEIMRYTLLAETGTKPLDIELVNYDHLMDEFLEQGMSSEDAYDEAVKMVDGFQYVSEQFFRRSILNIPDKAVRGRTFAQVKEGDARRFSFRLTAGFGLLKGDGAIASDVALMSKFGRIPDVVQPAMTNPKTGVLEMVNLKTEYATDGSWWIFTANMHHSDHQPMTNDQVLSIMSMEGEDEPWLFPKEELKASHLAFVGEAYESLKNGEFPSFMKSDWMSSESGEVKMDPDRLAMRIQQLSVRWTMSGRSLMESGHFINMVGNGFWNRLNAAVNKRRKIMIPIPHASYLHVTSLSVATMVGYDPEAEGYDTSKCFYYERIHSWVKPDAVFHRDYARHGGEDHDDSEMILVRWTYDEDKGETAENPVMRAVAIRMPCAKGEFSIVEIDDTDFPYHNTWGEMPTVNITKGVRPLFIEEMKEEQEITGLQYSNRTIPTEYTSDECKYITSLILINPGIGRYINPLIAYYDTFGTFPPIQLANTEDIVDTLKQTPDEDAFIAINGEIDRLLNEIITSGLVIDQHIYETRLQSVELPKDVSTTTSVDGYFYEMWSFTRAVMADWKQKVKELVRNREVIPVTSRLAELGIEKPDTILVPDAEGGIMSVSRIGHTKWLMAMFNKAQARYGNIPKGEAKRQFSGMLNRNFCMMLDKMPVDSRDWVLLTTYELIMASKDKKDIILFQTPLDGNEFSVMDFFLNALYNIGLAAKVNYTDFTRVYKQLVESVEMSETDLG